MAVRHVKVGGTKIDGNSTADDWSLGNCYATIATAMAGSTAGAGDEVILEHLETHVVSSMIADSLNFAGAFTVRGRFARTNNLTAPGSVISGSNASGALFIFNDSVNRADIEFKDVLFTKSVTHTDSTRPVFIHFTQKTGDAIFTRVWVKDVSVAMTGSTSWRLGMFAYLTTATAAVTVDLNSVRFENITGSFGTGQCALLFELAVNGNAEGSQVKMTNLVGRNCSATVAGIFRYISSNGATAINGFDVEGFTLTSSNTTAGTGTVYRKDSTGFLHARNLKLKNVLATSGYCDAAIQVWSEHDIKNVLGIRVRYTSTNHDDTGGIGAIVAVFNGKKGRTRNVRAYQCLSKFGTAVYYSNGASGVVDNVWAEECECGNGIFYKGGNGDVAWSNLVAVNNTQIDVVASSSAALVFHGHNGGSSGDTRDCLIGVRSLIAKGNYHPQGARPIELSYTGALYSLSAVMRDIVCRDVSSLGVTIRASTTLVNLDIADSNLNGGAASIENAGTGSVTESGTTDSDVVIVGGLSMDTELDDRWPVAYRVAS